MKQLFKYYDNFSKELTKRVLRRFIDFMSLPYLRYYYRNKNFDFANKRVCSDLIISLTSFPARIDYVWLTISSLMNQTIQPHKIILWLSLDQFQGYDDLPMSLKSLVNFRFEIKFVEGDIRSHKKYFYVVQKYPNYDFITVDDDVVYDINLVESLLETHRKYPDCVCANYVKNILIDANSNIKEYKSWKIVKSEFSSSDNVQIGVGGVFYPRGILYKDVLNVELFKKLAFFADDLWLYFMTRINNKEVVKTINTVSFIPIKIKNNLTLDSVNNGEYSQNDVQFRNIFNYYK